MIIEEQNKEKEKRHEIKKIVSLLEDVRLPKEYFFRVDCVEIRMRYRFFGFKTSDRIGTVHLRKNNELAVYFDDEDDFIKLRKSFEDSKTKFNLILSGGYY